MKRNEIYKDSLKRGIGVNINPSLCFYSPHEVYLALTKNTAVKNWLQFISNHYIPSKARILLIYPCSAVKPYYMSRSYKRLYETLTRLGQCRNDVSVMTVSEPFGLVPEKFYSERTEWHDWTNDWYDCPGLFEWWCRRCGQPYDKDMLDQCIGILASYVALFLKKTKAIWPDEKIVAFIRTYSSGLQLRNDHTHRRILEEAAKIAGISIDMIPPKRLIAKIVANNGRQAWDLYGVAHSIAQEYLLSHLRRLLKERTS